MCSKFYFFFLDLVCSNGCSVAFQLECLAIVMFVCVAFYVYMQYPHFDIGLDLEFEF